MEEKITSFEQLRVWQSSQNLAVSVYAISRHFPDNERYGLTSQLKRAVTSVSANIAEGFGRTGIKDKLQFYAIANGSLFETKNFLYLAEKLHFIDKTQLNELLELVTSCQKQLNAYMKAHRSRG